MADQYHYQDCMSGNISFCFQMWSDLCIFLGEGCRAEITELEETEVTFDDISIVFLLLDNILRLLGVVRSDM